MDYRHRYDGQVLRVKGSLCITETEPDYYDDGELVYPGEDLEVFLITRRGLRYLGVVDPERGDVFDINMNDSDENDKPIIKVISVAASDEITVVPEFLTASKFRLEE